MAKLIEGVRPTRMDLLKLKKRIKLATRGHELLSEKLDTLINEFFSVMKNAKGIREELSEHLSSGRKSLSVATALSPFGEIESAALLGSARDEIELEMRNLMGVKIPRLKVPERGKRRPYSLAFTSAKLDEAVASFESAFEKLLLLIESEESMRRIGEEIAKIKRRTNALEYILLPNLKHTKAYIEFRLEELERENFFRLKVIKNKGG